MPIEYHNPNPIKYQDSGTVPSFESLKVGDWVFYREYGVSKRVYYIPAKIIEKTTYQGDPVVVINSARYLKDYPGVRKPHEELILRKNRIPTKKIPLQKVDEYQLSAVPDEAVSQLSKWVVGGKIR